MSGPPLSIVGEALAPLVAYRAKPDPAPIKIDANESPWSLPEAARLRVAEVLAETPLHRYPDGAATELKAALAARLGARPEQLLLGAGSDEVIGILMAAFDRPRDGGKAAVLYPTPTFVMYPVTSRVHGFTPLEVPLDESYGLDVPAIRAALADHATNLVFLASPNNPTGNRFGDQNIEEIIRAAPDALTIVDEAYVPFAGRSLGDWTERHPNMGVMGTLSKVGLAGLRVGWIRMHPELVLEAEKARPPYNLGVFTQRLATLFLTELADVLDGQVRAIVEARDELGAALGQIEGVRVAPSEANFFLIEVEDAAAIQAALRGRGILVRRFANDARLARSLRVTVGTPEENERFVAALRAGIDALSATGAR